MNTKPVSPIVHGIIDYVFSAALITVPQILKLNKKAKWLYAADAVNTASYSALTNYPMGIERIIPYKLHRLIDIDNIAILALATLYKPIRKNKRALRFHFTMLTTAILTVLLTNWNNENSEDALYENEEYYLLPS